MTDDSGGVWEDYEAALAAYPARPLAEEPLGGQMMYSSGTTGRPKGILRPLPDVSVSEIGSPQAEMFKALWNFSEETVYLSPAPLYHSAPLAAAAGLHSIGGTVVMMPRFDELAALAALQDYKVTHSQWVPTMFTRMLKLDEQDRHRFDLSSHQVAIHGAAPCPPSR